MQSRIATLQKQNVISFGEDQKKENFSNKPTKKRLYKVQIDESATLD